MGSIHTVVHRMGVHDIIPPSLLAKEVKQPFLLVKLRVKQKDVDFSLEKIVLRAGTEADFKAYAAEWEKEGIECALMGDGHLVHTPQEKKILILSRQGDSHKVTFKVLMDGFPDYHLQWRDG
eukprot:TRINITY_DN1229_c0_g1_i10.p1 TRINITY_DN1229_c0_g1~~TRINITY_DN1229_c0_g1_i10.p1  ORF type:complete len:137 (-),score=56.05 TRINITY_DN1229_c0_g1_i10:148-513(-)